jgi:membrane protein
MDSLKAAYRRANDLSGGSLEILRHAVRRFEQARAPEAAASLAYYALFSLFPLLIALVAAGSFVLEREQVYEQAMGFVARAFPISQQLIERNIQQVLELRGSVGILGLIGLLWSGTGFFTVLARNVNRAWPEAEPRDFLESRLVAFGMVGILAGLLILSLLSTAVVNLLPRLQVPLWGGVSIYETPLWTILSNLIPWLFAFLTFLGLYLWVPNVEVGWGGPLWGALVTALAWEIAASAFTWFLSSGLASYQLVYGSLGTVVALMVWIYVGSSIILFGSHLSAAITQRTCRRCRRTHAVGF